MRFSTKRIVIYIVHILSHEQLIPTLQRIEIFSLNFAFLLVPGRRMGRTPTPIFYRPFLAPELDLTYEDIHWWIFELLGHNICSQVRK